jgi:hypothetical protein
MSSRTSLGTSGCLRKAFTSLGPILFMLGLVSAHFDKKVPSQLKEGMSHIFNVLAVVAVAILLVFLLEGLKNKTIRKLPQAFSNLFRGGTGERSTSKLP